jgi:hypothetical protein
MDKDINLAAVLELITISETAFGDPGLVATVELKLVALEQTNYNFSTYYTSFQYYATNVQWNDPARCTTLLQGLNYKIKDVLTLCHNVLQQFQEFFAFLQWLNN